MKYMLFICNQGMNRSKTAAEMYNGKYAGVYSKENPVTVELLDGAEVIYVMEEHQKNWIGVYFPKQFMEKKIICLNIPDIYSYAQDKLKKELKIKIEGSDLD
jgi:predicted protein tyrosine phosphatase